MASLKADTATLLSTMLVVNERLDQLEARIAAVEARLPWSPSTFDLPDPHDPFRRSVCAQHLL